MNVVIFVEGLFSLSRTFIIRKIKALAERGAQVTVVSFKRSRRPIHTELLQGIRNVRLIELPGDEGTWLQRAWNWISTFAKAFLRSPRQASRFWALTRRHKPFTRRLKEAYKLMGVIGLHGDVYHFEFGRLAAEYIDYIKTDAKPCVVSFRGSDILVYPHIHPELKAVYREVIEHASRVHCTSQGVAHQVAQLGGQQKIFINYPSVDTSFFCPNPNSQKDPNLIITVGRLEWVKGLPFALLAIAKLATDFPSLRYMIVGDGTSKDDLLFYTADLGIQDHVQFYGQASATQVKKLLEQASIFLLSSVSEGVSNAALEAMAMQVPVVTSAAGGMAEAVEDGVEGFVVPCYDPSALATKLRVLLDDEALREKMGENARQRILRDFTIERQVQVFLDEYSLLSKASVSSKDKHSTASDLETAKK
jgi:colanic acid/amylovoran biosynthesis glycosyltransferase